MKVSNLRKFDTILKKLFKLLAVKINNIELAGTYETSYFASDIDLHEYVEFSDIKKIMKNISKLNNVIEVKIEDKNGKHKFQSDFNNIPLPSIDDNVSLIKVDFIIDFFVFPIECSMMYDFSQKESNKTIAISMLDDIPQYNWYKGIKRMDKIIKMLFNFSAFDDILNDTELGVLYLSYNRLQVLKKFKISKEERSKMISTIHENLRQFGYDMNVNFNRAINDRVKHLIKTYYNKT